MSNTDATENSDPRREEAVFAGGCFWCVESAFDGVLGVDEAVSGYTGGDAGDATYAKVSSGHTGHVEAVRVRYDPAVVSYERLLEIFWRQIDPTDDGGQFADRGAQYRTAIFVANEAQRAIAEKSKRALEASGTFARPIATQILAAKPFHAAEPEHQNYCMENREAYLRYRRGSGRAGFLETTWGTEARGAARDYRKPPREELEARLSPLQLRVTQEGDTERAFQNAYWNFHGEGIYVDVASGEPLFSSRDKFDSGTGWPSFTRPIVDENVVRRTDRSLLGDRVEVRSRHGDSHLGHVFEDGPKPTGLRYCINSAALRFVAKEDLEREGYAEFIEGFRSPER